MRRIATFRNGADYKHIEVGDGGYPVYGSGGEFRRASDYLYDGVSVLFGRKGTIGKPLLVSGRFWTVDTMFFTELSPEVEPRYLHYYATTMPFDYYSTSTALPSITQTDLGGHRMPLPPLDVQRAIADFLDRETARIDVLIAEQQKLVELLRERKRSVANVSLGWRVGHGDRLKWLFVEIDERAGAQATTLPLLSVSISWGVRRRDEVTDDDARAEDLSNYKTCGRGELVINRMRAFQGALGIAPEEGIVSPDYAVLRPAPGVDGDWLAAVMKTDVFVGEMASRIKGIGSVDLGSARTPRINISDLAQIRLDVPARSVQTKELSMLRTEVIKVDALIAESERFIELARERRAALITAAVTGQIDVRRAA